MSVPSELVARRLGRAKRNARVLALVAFGVYASIIVWHVLRDVA